MSWSTCFGLSSNRLFKGFACRLRPFGLRFSIIFGFLLFILVTCCNRFVSSYQYSETNVMNFLFNLLRIKGIYMFRALISHPQEALNKRHLVYCVRVMSVGCTRIEVNFHPGAPQYTKFRLFSAC
jgi:hypothetical protein